MNKQDIENIRLGPKQISFGFEKDLSQYQDDIASGIQKYCEQYGDVVLDRFAEYTREQHGFACADVLQLIFWLAKDHRIQFRIDGQNAGPHDVKKVLMESPGKEVRIIFHQPVEEAVLADVQRIYAQLTGNDGMRGLNDPHDFSRLLEKEVRRWDDCLKSCRHAVEQPGFPGKNMVADGLLFIKKICARLDPFSLIHSFYENKKEILKVSGNARMLYGFYARHADEWETLIRSARAFEDNRQALDQIPGVCEDLRRLNHILLSEYPYDRVEEAKQLVDCVTPHHRQIIEEKTEGCRREAVAQVDSLIEKAALHMDVEKIAKDVRRQTLFALREIRKKIQTAMDIHAITRLTGEAEDAYDIFVEEIRRSS